MAGRGLAWNALDDSGESMEGPRMGLQRERSEGGADAVFLSRTRTLGGQVPHLLPAQL